MSGEILTGIVIGALLMFILLASIATPDQVWHKEAVRKGHAEFYFDTNYQVKWRWK